MNANGDAVAILVSATGCSLVSGSSLGVPSASWLGVVEQDGVGSPVGEPLLTTDNDRDGSFEGVELGERDGGICVRDTVRVVLDAVLGVGGATYTEPVRLSTSCTVNGGTTKSRNVNPRTSTTTTLPSSGLPVNTSVTASVVSAATNATSSRTRKVSQVRTVSFGHAVGQQAHQRYTVAATSDV